MRACICRKFLLLILPAALLPGFVHAAVSQVSFTTEPQTVRPGETSGTLTIQLQDSGGNSSPSTETVDVEFVSSSATGEFLSPNSENPVTKTISTGSSNKNFRYRDSAEGVFTLTINAKGRTSGLTWSVSQNITISSSASTSTSTTEAATSTSSSSSGGSSSSSSSSAHYGSSSLSKKTEAVIALSAGRDRVGSVGSPLEFTADTNLEYTRNGDFKWNFGDGSEDSGEILTHTYYYPGEYVVVLNATFPEGKAVARANVKIVDPEIEITLADAERIEIKNKSKNEISLYGRVLWAGGKAFVFPQDTIIKAGQNISFGSRITGLTPTGIYEVQLVVVGDTEKPQLTSKIEEEVEEQKTRKIELVQNEIAVLQQQLASLPQPTVSPPSSTPVPPVIPLAVEVEETLPEEPQPALVLDAVEDVERGERGIKGWLGVLKRFFLRTND